MEEEIKSFEEKIKSLENEKKNLKIELDLRMKEAKECGLKLCTGCDEFINPHTHRCLVCIKCDTYMCYECGSNSNMAEKIKSLEEKIETLEKKNEKLNIELDMRMEQAKECKLKLCFNCTKFINLQTSRYVSYVYSGEYMCYPCGVDSKYFSDDSNSE